MAKKHEKTDRDQLKEQLARALADYDNLKKRSEREKEIFYTLAKEAVIANFLPIFDMFEQVQKHVEDSGMAMALGELSAKLREDKMKKMLFLALIVVFLTLASSVFADDTVTRVKIDFDSASCESLGMHFTSAIPAYFNISFTVDGVAVLSKTGTGSTGESFSYQAGFTQGQHVYVVYYYVSDGVVLNENTLTFTINCGTGANRGEPPIFAPETYHVGASLCQLTIEGYLNPTYSVWQEKNIGEPMYTDKVDISLGVNATGDIVSISKITLYYYNGYENQFVDIQIGDQWLENVDQSTCVPQ